MEQEHQKNVFERNMRLVFPNFKRQKKRLEKMHFRNYGSVVSRTQLEHVIRECNLHERNLKVMSDQRKLILEATVPQGEFGRVANGHQLYNPFT
mmetsp:Transcript_6797/g.11442  ORF Transcript_6797/g.11442 Transcript_6797/m.11442 type:complete len:94 (-) Transcript_6797:1445-1726(-)